MRKIVLLALTVLLSSCATVNVDVDYDQAADFAHLYQYAWLEDKQPQSGNALFDSNTLMHDRIRNGVDQWMNEHGYLKGPAKEADFLVLYRLVVENKTRVTVLNPYYDYPYSWRFGYRRGFYSSYAWSYYPDQQVYEYQRGTLVIDIVEPNSKKLMWRGMSYEDISPHTSREKKQKYVDRAIKAILSRFPPPREEND